MGQFDHILLRANSVEGICVAAIEDYPEAEMMTVKDFYESLRFADEEDIFTMVMPEGTDGNYEWLNDEYGISK